MAGVSEGMSPKELIEYADKVMTLMVAADGVTMNAVQLQATQLTVDSARLAVELATLKLAVGPRPRWVK